ncbi:MAG: DUF4292 domain-containing protein [Bacteroidales bacterium]|nr:DUF4292 domain-containing protein [Bacteroidales bacterium]
MKKVLPIIFALLLLVPMSGCRSKQVVTEPQVVAAAVEEPTWGNVKIPVKVSIVKPQKISFSGTATMVRGEYVLISMRFLGFEIGQMHLTPEVADMVVKQPAKVWIQTPVSDYFKTYDVSFAALQEVMLGNRDALAKVPKQFTVEVAGTEEVPEVTLKGKLKGKELELKFAWEIGNAKWNTSNPNTFSSPGANYKKTSLSNVLKALGGI